MCIRDSFALDAAGFRATFLADIFFALGDFGAFDLRAAGFGLEVETVFFFAIGVCLVGSVLKLSVVVCVVQSPSIRLYRQPANCRPPAINRKSQNRFTGCQLTALQGPQRTRRQTSI